MHIPKKEVVSSETVAQRCSIKKVFLEISQNSQENTYERVSFLIKLHLKLVLHYNKYMQLYQKRDSSRGGFRAAATSKMERFVIIVNGYHKAVHLGYCSSPRSASDSSIGVFL